MIELSLPAGNLENALVAFKAGAHSVYFGMKEFSARKAATNFSLEDLAKIRKYSLDNNKKIYITINTLIKDEDLNKVVSLLEKISFYGCDGIICQDLGVAKIIKEHFPSLSLHASTQLAVHTISGVKFLQSLGFKRVVLSRELNLEEIKKIRLACPDVELKVFIHGALCYGFSGLCMASYQKCKRSANGGECAQICRTYFKDLDSGKDGYYFSLEDLNAGYLLKELDKIKIDSAKIEGRLKGDKYVSELTKYYLSILNDMEFDEDSIKTTFLRKSGRGYLNYKKGRDPIVSSLYPSHLGLECGTVIKQNNNSITVKSTKLIREHDGLQILVKEKNGLFKSIKFSAHLIKPNILLFNQKYDVLNLPIYKISSSTQNERSVNTSLLLYKKPIDITLSIYYDHLEAKYNDLSTSIPLSLQEAKQESDIKANLSKIFSESDQSKYTLKELIVNNYSSFKAPFLPLSIVKSLRRQFYLLIDSKEDEKITLEIDTKRRESIILPDRKLLCKDLPWSLEVTHINGYNIITLPPVTFNEELLFSKVDKIISNYDNLLVGINNIGQLELAKKYKDVKFFADIYLYLTNRECASLLNDYLCGGYLYLEYDSYDNSWPFEPTITDYEPPIFISRSCFRHDSKQLDCKTCKGRYDYLIEQNGEKYVVKVRDCLTVVEKK